MGRRGSTVSLVYLLIYVQFWLKQAIAFADQAGQTSPELPDSTFVYVAVAKGVGERTREEKRVERR